MEINAIFAPNHWQMASVEAVSLACHAYGAHSADIIKEVSALMCLGATVEQLRDIVHIHPTLGEILLTAAEQYRNKTKRE